MVKLHGPETALSANRNTVALYKGLAAADPRHEPTLARAQYRLGHSLIHHQPAEAEGPLREAVRLLQAPAATDAANREILARSLTELGIALAATGRAAEALNQATEGILHYRALAEVNPAQYSSALAGVLGVFSGRLEQLGHHQKASAAREEAAAIRSKLTDHPLVL